jgi:predicted methyltransferase
MFNIFSNAVKITHNFVAPLLGEGAVAVDATVGNGYDTLFLARNVGFTGRVYGFDIQAEALDRTGERLHEAGFSQLVTLVNAGHERMADYVTESVDVIMFNLGYLPGSDHKTVTKASSTTSAITSGLELLRPGGLMSVVVYTGHPGAAGEQYAVELSVAQLDRRKYCVMRMEFVNRSKNPPYLILIEKYDASLNGGNSNEKPKA